MLAVKEYTNVEGPTNCKAATSTTRQCNNNDNNNNNKTIKVRDNKLNRRFGVDITPLSR